jgi:phage terminase large subunit-like protein
VKRRTRGYKVASWIEANCVFTQGQWIGKPFRLLDWQKRLLLELFELDARDRRRYRWALLGVPKKNGKTELAAALALYLLIGDGEPSPLVVCAAASDGQADLVFDAAKTMCERSPTLNLITERYEREILVPSIPGARLRRVSAAAGTNEGLNCHAVICDELHEWVGDKGRGVWNVLTNSTGARRQPLVFQITTAGFDTETVCGEQYAYGKSLKAGELDDPRFFFHWVEAPQNADHKDPEVWKAANPSFGVTLEQEFFEDQLRKKPENVFRRYFLNQWTEAEDGWIEPAAWDACKGEVQVEEAERICLGVDVGHKRDATAIVAVGMVDNKFHAKAKIRMPKPGSPVAAEEVRADITDFCQRFDIQEIAYDPTLFRESAEMLQEKGLPMVEFPQTERMVEASGKTYELIRERRLVHDGDPLFRSHMLAAVPGETERGIRISKRKSKKPIDAAIALAMAVHRVDKKVLQPIFEVVRVESEEPW